jgi:hypothetical protein
LAMAMTQAAATRQSPRRDGLSYARLVVLTVTGSSPMRTIVARYISFEFRTWSKKSDTASSSA